MAELNELRDRIAAAFGGDVLLHHNSVGSGFWLPSGREIGVQLNVNLTEDVVITDSGDTWAELMSDCLVDREPTSSERERVAQCVTPFGVVVERDMTLSLTAHSANIADAVRRMVLASASALAVVRTLASERGAYDFARRREIVNSVTMLAQRNGWRAVSTGRVRGASGHEWPCNVLLDRGEEKQSSGVLITHESPSRIIERAFGWRADTKKGLVVVTNEARVRKLSETKIAGVTAIADDGEHVDARVLRAAEETLAA